MDKITAAYLEIRQAPAFAEELADLYRHDLGRPSPIFHAKNLSTKYGTDIYART